MCRAPVDLERQKVEAAAAFEKYGPEPKDGPVIAPKTEYNRRYIMAQWTK
jgi:hypothetical protein